MNQPTHLSMTEFERYLELPVDSAVLARYVGLMNALYRYLCDQHGLTETEFASYFQAVKQEAVAATTPSQAKRILTLMKDYHARAVA